MTAVAFPAGFRIERLRRVHPRNLFHSGERAVDEWFRTKALQHQQKQLSVTTVLDCLNDSVKAFYFRWGFQELPGQPYRLFISTTQLGSLMKGDV